MLDPISILTATGFAIQALEFLIHAGLKAQQMGQAAKECEASLRAYGYKLFNCIESLTDWNEVWEGFEDKIYEHFWGEAGFRTVQSLLNDVLILSLKIRRQVEGHEIAFAGNQQKIEEKPHGWKRLVGFHRRRNGTNAGEDLSTQRATLASGQDLQVWRSLTDSVRDKSSAQLAVGSVTSFVRNSPFTHIKVDDPSVLKRISFSLFSSTVLQERLSRLEDFVKQLDDISRREFRRMRGIESHLEEPVTKGRALAVEKMKRTADDFAAFITELYASYSKLKHEVPWSLELRLPDERGSVSQFETMREIHLDFTLLIDGKLDGGSWRRVRISYKATKNPRTDARELARMIVSPGLTLNSEFRKRFCILSPLQKRSIVFRTLLKGGRFEDPSTFKAWEEDRANLVFGLANWTILTWNSPWTSVPCCCGIRFLQLDRAPRQYTFAMESHRDCRNPSLANHKLLLLGIAIAELVIGRPLRIPFDPPFGMRGSLNSSRVFALEWWRADATFPSWKSCSRDEVLGEIEEKSAKESVREAVEYCFDNPSFSSAGLSPDAMLILIENILRPIESYQKTVSEQRQKTAQLSYWLEFLARMKTYWPDDTVFEQLKSNVSRSQPRGSASGRRSAPSSVLTTREATKTQDTKTHRSMPGSKPEASKFVFEWDVLWIVSAFILIILLWLVDSQSYNIRLAIAVVALWLLRAVWKAVLSLAKDWEPA